MIEYTEGDVVTITPIDSSMWIEYLKRFDRGRVALDRGNRTVQQYNYPTGAIRCVNHQHCEPLYQVELEKGLVVWLTVAHLNGNTNSKNQLKLEVEL
ncbi:MAG: hypothetical protein KUG64_10420 [Cycloclasticus sp.]|nr:hypothetical protein [Cycloclasticus sp.]